MNRKGSASPNQDSFRVAAWLQDQRKHGQFWEGSYFDIMDAVGVSAGSASGYLATRYRRGIVERIAIVDGRVRYRVNLDRSEVFNTRRMNSKGGVVGRNGGTVRMLPAEIPFITTRHLLKLDDHVFVLRNKISGTFWPSPLGRNPQDCWDKAIAWEKVVSPNVPENWSKEMHANGWRAYKCILTLVQETPQ